MEPRDVEGDLTEVLYTEAELQARIAELCRRIEVDYEGRDLLLVGVLRGAVMVMADRARELWTSQDMVMLEVMAEESDSTLGRVILYLAAHRGQLHAYVSTGAGDIASLELRHHQQKFYALSIVATVAPIVGLLGTVLGMIDAFHVIAYSEGMGNPALLAGGISKALVNTAAGLAVALPALGMHHFFKHRLAVLGLALEKQINSLLQEHFAPAAAPSPNLQVVHHAH